jgi:hypothetical protein
MRKWKSRYAVAALAVALAIWSALWAQDPAANPRDPAQQLQDLTKRVEGIEKVLAGLLASQETANVPLGATGANLATRLDRIEGRLTRIEAESRYRPGTPGSGGQVESRLSALEREVARLRP